MLQEDLQSADGDRDVLVVDDESGVRELMVRWLHACGYPVRVVACAEDALTAMEQDPAAVALCDIRMPGHDGLWLADHLRQAFPETAIIMATAVQDVGPAVTSLRSGVLDYLLKPFGRDRLREAVQRGIEWHRNAVESRRWRTTLEEESRARSARLAEAIAGLQIDRPESLDALLAMMTFRDRDAYAHAYRVVGLAVSVARLLELSEAEVTALERAALFHDLGKLAMPEAVVRKPAPLTIEEQDLVRTHPQVAYDLIRQVPYLAEAAEIVRGFCERVDGLGYPRGLRGDEIPLGSRILAVVEAFDTMTRPRVFRDAMAPDEAFLELARCTGGQFDPHVVRAFRRVVDLH